MLITCQENKEVSISENGLNPQEVDQLQRLAKAAANNLKVPEAEVCFRSFNALKFGSVVGILATPTRTIEVLPKIDGEQKSVRITLVSMLAVAQDLRLSDQDLATLESQPYDLLEALICIFSKRLQDAVQKDVPRRYEIQRQDLPILRGKLDVTRQFTRFAARADRLACIWDELTENTPLNRVLKAAVNLLIRLSKTSENRRRLFALRARYELVGDVRHPLREQVSLDRTNVKFHSLYRFARLFLSRRYQSTTHGREVGITLLFSMHELFEKFIGRCLKRALVPLGYEVHLQCAQQYAVRKREEPAEELFKLIPDVVIRLPNCESAVILDTKWKRLDYNDKRRGIDSADMYQVLNYGHAYKAKRIILLFPYASGNQTEGVTDKWESQGDDPPIPLDIATIDIRRKPDQITANLPRQLELR